MMAETPRHFQHFDFPPPKYLHHARARTQADSFIDQAMQFMPQDYKAACQTGLSQQN